MGKSKVSRRYLILIAILILWSIAYAAGHNAYVSDYLKGKAMEMVPSYTDQRVTMDEIVINPLPFFFEARGIRVNDNNGKWLEAKKVKIYLDIFSVFSGTSKIRRILVDKADIELTTDKVGAVSLLRDKGAKGGQPLVSLIDIRHSSISFSNGDLSLLLKNFNLSSFLKGAPEIKYNFNSSDMQWKGIDIKNFGSNGHFVVRPDVIDIRSVSLNKSLSSLIAKGKYKPGRTDIAGEVTMDLDVDDINEILKLKVKLPGRISGRGRIEYKKKELFLDSDLSGQFYLETLMSIFRKEVPVRGLTVFDGKMAIKNGKITGSADAELIKGHVYGVDIDRVSCDASYEDNILYFRNGTGQLYGGKARAEVYLMLPKIKKFMVDVKVDGARSGDLLSLIRLDLGLAEGRVQGEIRSEGKKFRPEGRFISTFVPVEGDIMKRVVRAEGSFKSMDETIRLNNIKVLSKDSAMNFSGEYGIKSKSIDLDGKIISENLGDLVHPYYDVISGPGIISYSVNGYASSPIISADVSMTDVSHRSMFYKELSARLIYRKEKLRLMDFRASLLEEEYRLRGAIRFKGAEKIFDFSDPELELNAELSNIGLKNGIKEFGLDIPVDGNLSGRASIRGPRNDMSIISDVVINDTNVLNYSVGTVRTRIKYSGHKVELDDIRIETGGSVISGKLSIDERGNYRFKTESAKIELSQLPFDLNIDGGTMDVDLTGRGTLNDPFVKAKLTITDATTAGVPIGDSVIKVILDKKKLSATGELFDSKAAMKGYIYLKDGYDWSLDVSFDRKVYDFIPAYILGEAPEGLMLSMEGDLRLSGNKRSYDGQLLMSSMIMNIYGMSFVNDSDISITLKKNVIGFDKVRLRSGNALFAIEGRMEPLKSIDLFIYGDSSLSALSSIFNSIDYVRGYGSMSFAVSGPWRSPEINGGISLKDGVIGITGMPFRINDISGYLYVDNNRVIIESIYGDIGGGRVDISGYGRIRSYLIDEFYLDVKLSGSTISLGRGMVITVDGGLIMNRERDDSFIVGQIDVKKALLSRSVDWRSKYTGPGAVLIKKEDLSQFDRTKLNIKISGNENIVVNNNVARSDLIIDLLLRGTVSDPLLFGRIVAEKGVLYFRNNEFEIVHASADFVENKIMNPFFDISAKTVVKGYDIHAVIEGQMPQLNLTLTSNPPLEEADILGLLAVGELGSQLGGLEAGIGTAEATSFLTGKYRDALEERLTLITGLDRLNVEPYVSAETGEISPRVTASKRIIEDKLFVTYSSTVGISEEDVIKLEYKVNKYVSIVGESDEDGSLSGDLKIRFEFK
ncbi:MAG: translocation/assembly module TamB domain-containing protein [Nitrospirota bacterium]|nr:MAG: translocation/assembly module TamB domain-containing protein [Nitrospirota bacterium]